MASLKDQIISTLKDPGVVDMINNLEDTKLLKEDLSPLYSICSEHLEGVSEDDFTTAFKEMLEEGTPLDDNDLEMAAGGAFSFNGCFKFWI